MGSGDHPGRFRWARAERDGSGRCSTGSRRPWSACIVECGGRGGGTTVSRARRSWEWRERDVRTCKGSPTPFIGAGRGRRANWGERAGGGRPGWRGRVARERRRPSPSWRAGKHRGCVASARGAREEWFWPKLWASGVVWRGRDAWPARWPAPAYGHHP